MWHLILLPYMLCPNPNAKKKKKYIFPEKKKPVKENPALHKMEISFNSRVVNA